MSENNLNLVLQSFAHGGKLISLKATQGKTKGIKNMRITKKNARKVYETMKNLVETAKKAGFANDQFIPVCCCSINDLTERMNQADAKM